MTQMLRARRHCLRSQAVGDMAGGSRPVPYSGARLPPASSCPPSGPISPPPCRSPASPSASAAVCPTRVSLRLAQGRVPPHPRLQRSALQIPLLRFLPTTGRGVTGPDPQPGSAGRVRPVQPRRGTVSARPAVLPGRTPAAANGEARRGRGSFPIGGGGRRSRDLKLE